MRRRSIQVFEHSVLCIDESIFPSRYFDKLVQYNDRHKGRYFDVGHRRIRFKSHVGVIQVADLTIEILPKADRYETGDTEKWREALLDMLRTCKLLNIDSTNRASLRIRKKNLLDLYFESFLAEVRQLVHEGLRKNYRHREANRNNFKGRLVFKDQIKRNLVHRERFFTRAIEYDRNFRLNQILVTALNVLRKIPSPSIAAKASKLLIELEDIHPINVDQGTFNRIVLDSNTIRYSDALKLSQLIILNYTPDLKGGAENLIAILFDMNVLFEEYVFNLLRKASRDFEYLKVSSQKSKVFWRSESMAKSIRPDIVVEWEQDGSTDILIIDTKWKIPKDNRPSDEDLKQMYAYNLQFGAGQSVLLYPKTESSESQQGRYSEAPMIHDAEVQSSQLHFAELFDDFGDLDKDLGISLIRKLLFEKKPSNPLAKSIQIQAHRI